MIKKSLASVFKEFDDEFEVVVAAIVRVGHDGVSAVVLKIRGHHHHFATLIVGLCKAEEFLAVAFVHSHYEVELAKVFVANGTRTVGELIAMACGMGTHAAVGEFSFVIVNKAGRVGNDFGGLALAVGKRAEYLFGRARAADVSQANEKHAVFGLWVGSFHGS